MKSIAIKLTLLVALICSLGSCRKDDPIILDSPHADYVTNGAVDALFYNTWNAVNHNYLFWDIDPTDWDAVYEEYEPLFATLNDQYTALKQNFL